MSDLITFEPSTQITFHTGDCLSVMRSLPDACVDCCITSPPYYNLRDYRHAGQIGCEEHLEDYISRLVEVFSEVKRLLKPCGTIWLVLGDCYLNKNRLLVPAQVALALRDRCGLILRDEIIYSKPRTTPSPVKDRTAAAHEFVYMFSKSPTYYYDYLAIEEASKYAGAIKTYSAGKQKNVGNVTKAPGSVPRTIVVRATRRKRSVWSISPEPFRGAHTASFPTKLVIPCVLAGCPGQGTVLDPFAGSGTTGLVARSLDRRSVLIELNPDYVAMAKRRLEL